MIMDSNYKVLSPLIQGKPEEEVFLEEANDAEIITMMGMDSDIPPSEMQRQNDSFEYRF